LRHEQPKCRESAEHSQSKPERSVTFDLKINRFSFTKMQYFLR
jgi:hypothetical protein